MNHLNGFDAQLASNEKPLKRLATNNPLTDVVMIDGKRLRELREAAGYSREKFAEAINLGVSQVTRYERGESDATTDVLARMATALEVSADYLIGLTDSPLPSDWELRREELAMIAALRRGDYKEAIKIMAMEE